MKKLFYILPLVLFAVVLNSCDEMYGPEQLPEHVKTMTKWSCDTDSENYWIKINKIEFEEYNIYGDVVKAIKFHEDGSTISQESQVTHRADSSFLELIEYNLDGSVLNHNKTNIKYTFKKFGNIEKILREVRSDTSGKISVIIDYIYDDDGKLLRKDTEVYNNQTSESTTYEYDGKNVIDIKINPGDNGGYEMRDSLVYYNGNKWVDIYTFNSEGKISGITTNVYDASTRIQRQIRKSAKGEVLSRYQWEYTFF
jgi:hypothetical protein